MYGWYFLEKNFITFFNFLLSIIKQNPIPQLKVCIIVPRKNIKKIKRNFSKKFMPYEIGFISKEIKEVNIVNNLRW